MTDKEKFLQDYSNGLHKIGRITLVIAVIMLLAVPFIMLYNGKRGKLKMKYVFYIFYPAHLAILDLINELI